MGRNLSASHYYRTFSTHVGSDASTFQLLYYPGYFCFIFFLSGRVRIRIRDEDVGLKERWSDLDLARLACTWLHLSPLASIQQGIPSRQHSTHSGTLGIHPTGTELSEPGP